MLNDINIEDVLFLDIETAPLTYKYSDLDDQMKKFWDLKFRYAEESSEELYIKAGIYAEFAKVICISVGIVTKDRQYKTKSYYGDDEIQLLGEFFDLLDKHYGKLNSRLCAHNGKEFDFPFICRRALINGVKLPKILDTAGKKPWEVKHLDTMELWKFGDYKNFTSLSLLAAVFGIPTPKDDIDGSQVSKVYWEEKNMERIVTYCQKDVLTVAQLFLKYKGEPLIQSEQVQVAD